MKKFWVLFLLASVSGFSQTAGSLDLDFNSTGVYRFSISPDNDFAYCLAIDNQQKIIVGGVSDSANSVKSPVTVVRMNPDGSFDNSFSTDGIAQTMIGNSTVRPFSLLVQKDRKILVVAQGDNELAMVRFNVNGSLDNTFSFDGKVLTTAVKLPQAATLDNNGNIYVVGDKGITGSELVVAKFKSDGSSDQNFGVNGVKEITLVNSVFPKRIIVDNDGNIYIGGHYLVSQSGRVFLTKLDSNGSIDYNFSGTLAYSQVVFNSSASLADMKQSSDGGFIMLAEVNSGIGLAKFAANGKLVAQFGGGGRTETLMGLKNFRPVGINEQADGKILVGGSGLNNSFEGFFLAARFTSNGIVDSSFANKGLKQIAMSNKLLSEWPSATATALQENGRFLIAGYLGPNNQNDMGIARLITGAPTSVEENIQEPNWSVSSDGFLLFVYTKTESQITLLDIFGRVVNEFNFSVGKTVVELNSLTSGTYILTDGKERCKFLKR